MISQSEEIFAFLKTLLIGFLDDVSEDSITPQSTIESLGMDSLDFVDLQVEFGKRYRVTVPPTIFASGRVKTLGQLVEHVIGLIIPAQVTPAA